MHEFDENVCVSTGLSPAVYGTWEYTGTAVDMAKYNNFVAAVVSGSSADFQGALTVVIAEATCHTVWSNTYLATLTLASSSLVDRCDTVEVRAEEMSDGYRYLRPEITPATGSGNLFAVINQRFNPRYGTQMN